MSNTWLPKHLVVTESKGVNPVTRPSILESDLDSRRKMTLRKAIKVSHGRNHMSVHPIYRPQSPPKSTAWALKLHPDPGATPYPFSEAEISPLLQMQMSTTKEQDSLINSTKQKEGESDPSPVPEDGPQNAVSDPSPETAPLLEIAPNLLLVERFQYLLHHTRKVIETNSAYRLENGIVTNNPQAKKDTRTAPEPLFVAALACAQDSLATPQSPGPSFDQLRLFTDLFTTTITLLDLIIESGELPLIDMGWGIYGLAAGYLLEDENINGQKIRLHTALQTLEEIGDFDSTADKMEREALRFRREETRDKVHLLIYSKRVVNRCNTLMLQEMRKEDWVNVRWAFMVLVVEKWVSSLGWDADASTRKIGSDPPSIDKEWVEIDGMWHWQKKPLKERRMSHP